MKNSRAASVLTAAGRGKMKCSRAAAHSTAKGAEDEK